MGALDRYRFLLGGRLAGAPLGLALVSALSGGCEAVLLVLVVRLAVAIGEGPDAEPLLGLDRSDALLLGLGLLVVLVGLHWVVARLAAGISTSTTRRVRRTVVDAYLRASWLAQRRVPAGELQELLGNGAGTISLASLSLASGVAGALVILVLLVVALVLDPLTSLALMAAGAVLILVLRPLPRWGQRGAAQALRGNTRFSGWIAHLPRLTQEVRLYGVTDQVEQRVADADEEANRGRYRQRLLYLLGPSLFKDGAVLVLLVVLALAGDLDEGSAARVGAVVLLLVRALAQAQFVYSVHGQVVAAYPHLDRVDAVLGELRASPRPHGTVVPKGFEELRLDGVTFAYDDGRAGLRGADLTVHRGEMLGVAGPSGGGKTTLVAVLLGLAEPASGRVMLDGVALGDLDPAAWSGMVGVVPQDAELVDGTLADNIRFYRDGVSDEAVRAAAEAARLDAFPEGFDTVLAEGAGVSGGQRQRIALARALVGSPQLLVLDEPTAALDPRTEELVRETLEDQHRRGTTLVIVAHRPTTLQACDRVVVIEGGVVQDVRRSGSKSSPS